MESLFVVQNGCFAKNSLGVFGSQWDTFVRPRVTFSHDIMQGLSLNTIVAST